MFVAALFIMSIEQKQPKHSQTDGWTDTVWYIHTMEYYPAIKKNEVLRYATTQMNLISIRPS